MPRRQDAAPREHSRSTNLRTLAEIGEAGRDAMRNAPPLTDEQVSRLRILLDPTTAMPERVAS